MDRESALKSAMTYAVEVKKIFDPYSIILYGSYANGTPDPESDIDVAVIFNDYQGDWLKDSALLWKLTRNVSTRIEPILLDRTQDANGFVNSVLNTGEVLYRVK